MRAASATDFTIPLPEVGDFTFARRTMGDMLKIRALYVPMMNELSPLPVSEDSSAGIAEVNDATIQADDWQLNLWVAFVAAYKVLIVAHPEDWTDDITDLDVNSVGVEKVTELAILLSAKESSFRLKKVGQGS